MGKGQGCIRLVRIGDDEPVHVPDAVIDALRKRERDGAIDPPSKRGLKAGDRVHIVTGLFTGRFGHCTEISREHIGVLLHMLGAQCRVRLRVDAVELAESQRTRRRAIP